MADFITVGANEDNNYSPPEAGRRVPVDTMTTTAVVDRSTITIAQMKTKLSITDASLDVELTLSLNAAKESADQYLNNPFTTIDEAGAATDSPIPASVEMGVLSLACTLMEGEYGNLLPSGGSSAPLGTVLTSVKTGDLSESYGALGSQAASVDFQLDAIRARYFAQYRFRPGFTHVRRLGV